MYRTIIVPLNGSARSERALPVAIRLAQASDAALELVSVFSPVSADPGEGSLDSFLRQSVRVNLKALAEATASAIGRTVEPTLLDPPVVGALQGFIASRPDPLVVMATHGRTGVSRAILGSVSDGLVRSGIGPVLALRETTSTSRLPSWQRASAPFKMIVAPLDGTTLAEAGLPHAVSLATLTGARVHLIRVVAPLMVPSTLGSGFPMQSLPPFDDATLSRQVLADDYLQGVVHRIRAANPELRLSTEIALSGAASASIVESCRRHGADLVVMATHGRGASRMLIRAVADSVIRGGTDAILLVRPTSVDVPAWMVSPRRSAVPFEPVGVGG